MQPAQSGDRITVVYEGKLESGEVFEDSNDTGPVSFVIGDGSVMPAFEAAVIGMKPGETKIIKIKPENAYGPHNPELVHTVSRASVNPGCELTAGTMIALNMEVDGQTQKVPGTVTALADDQVTIDFNHPLAGQDLLYKITLQAIDRPDRQEDGGCGPDTAGGCGN